MKKSTILVAMLAVFGAASIVKLTATNAFAQDAKSQTVAKVEPQEPQEKKGEEEEDDLLTAPCGIAQAVSVATKNFKGYVNKAELEKEKGKLVWSVNVVSPDGKRSAEVEIDGKTGTFIKSEIGDGEENDGDGDGETNDGPEGEARG